MSAQQHYHLKYIQRIYARKVKLKEVGWALLAVITLVLLLSI